MANTARKIFPIFFEKLPILAALSNEQISVIIRAMSAYTKEQPIEIGDELTRSIFDMLLLDYDRYDNNCRESREKQRAYREKKAQEKATQSNEQRANEEKEPPKPETDGKKPKKEKKVLDMNKNRAEREEIVEYFNQISGTHYSKESKDIAKLVNARFEEGYTVGDFKVVIEKMHRLWSTSEMQKWYRPKTLFAEGNFEGYLNQVDKTDAQIAAEAAFHKNYDTMIEWASEEEGDFYDAAGNDNDTRDHLGELPDFSKL